MNEYMCLTMCIVGKGKNFRRCRPGVIYTGEEFAEYAAKGYFRDMSAPLEEGKTVAPEDEAPPEEAKRKAKTPRVLKDTLGMEE